MEMLLEHQQQNLGRVREDVSATAKELSAAYGCLILKKQLVLAADIAATGKTGDETY
jgi:hypothetical protein